MGHSPELDSVNSVYVQVSKGSLPPFPFAKVEVSRDGALVTRIPVSRSEERVTIQKDQRREGLGHHVNNAV